MKLDSFKELLVKKSDGDSSLQSLIQFLREDALADIVVESLEKMARSRLKGDAANLAIRDFGLEMDPELEPTMIRDALGHHASRYKAALNHIKDNPDDSKMKDVANHHAGQIFNLVNMAEKTQKHTDGKLNIQAPPPHAWERNIKPDQYTEESGPVKSGKKKVGQFVNDTKGWNYSGYKGNKFEHLTHAPHEAYKNEAEKQGWDGPYPMEQIKVNGKYIHVDDSVPKESLENKEGHVFDSHPIMDHYKMAPGKRTAEHDEAYKTTHDSFHDNIPDHWWDKHSSFTEDHGKTVSAPVHSSGVKLGGPNEK